MANIISGTVIVPSGTNESPVGHVPPDANSAELRMTRQNWPAAGVLVTLWVSYDNQGSWVVGNQAQIDPGEPNPKNGILADAVIGIGWSTRQPTHAKIGTVNPSAPFQSTIAITVFRDGVQ